MSFLGLWKTGKKGEDQAEGQDEAMDIAAGDGEKMDTTQVLGLIFLIMINNVLIKLHTHQGQPKQNLAKQLFARLGSLFAPQSKALIEQSCLK